MSAADYDAHRLGQAQEWADSSEHPLTVQWEALCEAEALGEPLVRCRCGDGCSRCHGAGWLTLAQAAPPRLPPEPACDESDEGIPF